MGFLLLTSQICTGQLFYSYTNIYTPCVCPLTFELEICYDQYPLNTLSKFMCKEHKNKRHYASWLYFYFNSKGSL